MKALGNIGIAYGNHSLGYDLRHNLVQNLSPRQTDVLTLYPLDLNYAEERFGSWMVQYGYTNYITEDELLKNYTGCHHGRLGVKNETYRALVVVYSPFINKRTLDIMDAFLHEGGKVIWSSAYPLQAQHVEDLQVPGLKSCKAYPLAGEGRDDLTAQWKRLFGMEACSPAYLGKTAMGKKVQFLNTFSGMEDMEILTDMLPDFIYPVMPCEEATPVAAINGETVGTYKEYANGGAAVYLGFRPRDDQSGSTGRDIDTLFRILTRIHAYGEDSLEVRSRETDSPYLLNRFPNGAVSLTNHLRAYQEGWDGKFFRDEAADEQALAGRDLPATAIELEKFLLNGHTIRYAGQGVLTVHLDDVGSLLGFAGDQTTGITVNGHTYRFLDTPGDIAWAKIPGEHLCAGISRAYAVFSSQAGDLSLPLVLEDGNTWKTASCKQNLFDLEESVPFACDLNGVVLHIEDRAAGKWILLYQRGA